MRVKPPKEMHFSIVHYPDLMLWENKITIAVASALVNVIQFSCKSFTNTAKAVKKLLAI